MTRIAVLSHYWKRTSGFAALARGLLQQLAACPDVEAVHIVVGKAAAPFVEDGVTVYTAGDMKTQDVAAAVRAAWADVLIVILDPYFLQGIGPALRGVRVLRWVIVDSSPATADVVPACEGCDVVALSAFGARGLAAWGVRVAATIPGGIENTWRVQSDPAARLAARSDLVGPGCEHLTVIVSRNYPTAQCGDSKCFPQMLEAWATFAADKPGARLYVHSNVRGRPGEVAVPDLRDIAQSLGIGDRVTFPADDFNPTKGASQADLVSIYNAGDVLLSTSGAEGFGLPVLEAQACGVPVVVCDFGPPAEHVVWGRAVPPVGRQWNQTLCAWWAFPDATGGTAALQALYDEWRACGGCWPLEKRVAVSEAVHAAYGWDYVFRSQWVPVLRAVVS